MERFFVKKLTGRDLSAAEVPSVLDWNHVQWHAIDKVNWQTFPYCPHVEVRMAHTGGSLLLHYRVDEQSVAAVAPSDNGRVWEDACCEFFCCPTNDSTYYNLECNCAGTLLLASGKEREGRQQAPTEVLKQIDRWSSLGRAPFSERIGLTHWELALVVPVGCFFNHRIADLSKQTIKGNFYKCGDKLKEPHFLSLFPIDLPRPDFHRPNFFGDIQFE